jgi:23S rRNA pseudouridine2605 synthase
MSTLRLQKFLAECGCGSRRQCEDLIAQARVTVNGEPGTLGQLVDPDHDGVAVDGEPVERAPAVYIVLNKPKGAVTTARDDDDRDTVFDFLDGVDARVFPAGRLDMEVEGALILTNDGDLVHRLTQPGCAVERVYIATVRGVMSEATAGRMGEGILLEDGATVRARVRILHTGMDSSILRLALHEGGQARVRHLGAIVGHPVLELRRTTEAGIELGALEPGQWRTLDHDEIEHLRAQAGMTPAR